MQLQLQTFTALVNNAAAAVQGAASQLLDLTVGSVLRAILEANASMALWLQWLMLQVLRITRDATSQGGDLDSWVRDFGMQRLSGVAADGVLTFSRFTPTTLALVPAGATALSSDGTQTFVVVADTTNPAWSATQSGYVLAAGVASVSVAATAATAGSGGNVQPGVVSLLATAIPGVDTVTNAAAFVGGADAETDTALRTRFQGFLASQARATTIAVVFAIQGVRQGLLYSIAENQAPGGIAQSGFFTVTIDDGTGSPPSSLLMSVTSAIEPVRPLGSSFIVQAPTVWMVNISMTVDVGTGVSHDTTASNVIAAMTGFINSFSLGAPLTWSRIVQVAYSADANVINVTNVLLDGGTSDLIPPSYAVLKAGTITVN
jgi:uncharacterized phage protein gp47/JayE